MISGKDIKRLRKEKGITQEQLAEQTNVSQAHIARIESGKTDPRLSVVNKLFEALTVDARDVACKEIMSPEVVFAAPKEPIRDASKKMITFGFSQLPVIEMNERTGEAAVMGTVTERDIIEKIILGNNLKTSPVSSAMGSPMPVVAPETRVSDIEPLMEPYQAVLVMKDGRLVGIISRADLLRFIDRLGE